MYFLVESFDTEHHYDINETGSLSDPPALDLPFTDNNSEGKVYIYGGWYIDYLYVRKNTQPEPNTVSVIPIVTINGTTIAPSGISPGQQNVCMMKLNLATDTYTATWTAIKVENRASGTVSASDVDSVKIFKEVSGEGFSPSQDLFVGGNTMTGSSGGSGTVTFGSSQTIITSTSTYYIVYDISSTADPSDYVGVRLADSSYFSFTVQEKVSNTNFPIQSSYDSSLPVELSFFTAYQENGYVVLQWVTESEIENLGFILERREALIDSGFTEWLEIASYLTYPELEGQGSVTHRTDYNFVDSTVVAGVTYEYRLADVSYDGLVEYHELTSLTVEPYVEIPEQFELYQNYPNPFNPITTFKYDLPQPTQVTLKVYNILGQEIVTLINEHKSAGYHQLIWDASRVGSGIYFYHLKAHSFSKVKKCLVIK